MIEWYNIVGFFVFTAVLGLLEWFITEDLKRAIKVLPLAAVFSAVLNIVWGIL